MKKNGLQILRETGKRNGDRMLQERGVSFFSEIGKKSAQTRTREDYVAMGKKSAAARKRKKEALLAQKQPLGTISKFIRGKSV